MSVAPDAVVKTAEQVLGGPLQPWQQRMLVAVLAADGRDFERWLTGRALPRRRVVVLTPRSRYGSRGTTIAAVYSTPKLREDQARYSVLVDEVMPATLAATLLPPDDDPDRVV